ncbi:hypothetical protein J8L98_14295 [Pseudoalteromonas sp. MMG013]|uniref:hypothetical protein n=1 Tax=Pseudoalteromonas sp. MMG013 TaxID=2822687 RepID=UPI001B369FCE|nr:hypothetical protein [Pseudoalteromonas sp. MMG013]MBQ4862853.1 hypothetical protein [Pseudoalteromonas sp. MMG013]
MDILARINFLEVNDENWNAKYVSGFRSNINYGASNYCCLVAFEEDREIKQGETIDCELSFLTHEPHIGKLAKGMEFILFSGSVTFAKGIVNFVSE